VNTELEYIDVNGARLAYERHLGGSELGPLVFGHGYALRSSGLIYRELLARLTRHFEVYALDLRGHGASATTVLDWSQAMIADDLAAFVDAVGLKGATYAGHSMGGFTGLYAQIRHPGTFSALCLLATAVAAGGAAPAGVGEALVAKGSNLAARMAAFKPMYVRPTEDTVKRAAEAVGVMDPSVHRAFCPDHPRTVISGQLALIEAPVLFLNGGRDSVVSPEEQHKTALGLKRSKEVTLSSEGHMLPLEAPDMAAREIVNFCRYDVAELINRPPGASARPLSDGALPTEGDGCAQGSVEV
jgi:pimeloyl-ACP methyl ester carboxylesterase